MRVGAESDHRRDEVLALYGSVGWTGYTGEPDVLMAGLAASHLVLTARVDGRLVGLARTVSDDATICYVQDLLVDPRHHRQGIARALMTALQERYEHCRQFVLITDRHDPVAHAFYRAAGLTSDAAVFLRLR